MPPVYTFDCGLKTVVKIVKRGVRWAVYRLDHIEISRKGKVRFVFEKKPYRSWSYKPFEDKDVTRKPDVFLEDVKRWEPFKIVRKI